MTKTPNDTTANTVLLIDASALFCLSKAEGLYPKTDGIGQRPINGLDILHVLADTPGISVQIPKFIADFETMGGYSPDGHWKQLDRHTINRPRYPHLKKFYERIQAGDSKVQIIETDVDKELFHTLNTQPRQQGALQIFRKGEGNNGGDRALERLAFDAEGFTYIITEDGVFEDGIHAGLLNNKHGYPVSALVTEELAHELRKTLEINLEQAFADTLGVRATKDDINDLFAQIGNQSRHAGGIRDRYSKRLSYASTYGRYHSAHDDQNTSAPQLSFALDRVDSIMHPPVIPDTPAEFEPCITKDGLRRPAIELPANFLADAIKKRASEPTTRQFSDRHPRSLSTSHATTTTKDERLERGATLPKKFLQSLHRPEEEKGRRK